MAKENRGGRQHSGKAGTLGEESLISLKGHDEEVEQILEVQRDFAKEYGPAVNARLVVTDEPVNGSSEVDYLGFTTWEENKIAIRRSYFGKKMDQVYDEDANTGFHPPRGSKSGLQAVVAHEFGHYVTFLLRRSQIQAPGSLTVKQNINAYKKFAEDVISHVAAKTGYKDNTSVRRAISEYASTSDGETIAEAAADVYCNGKHAKKESQRVVDELKAYLQRGIK